MNSREKLMLDVMAELMRLQAPVVFKGAMLLKIATENTTSSVVRETKDLDGDWLQSDVSMEQMKDFVDDAIVQLIHRFLLLLFASLVKINLRDFGS